MKYYTVETIPSTLEYKIRVYKEDNTEKFSAVIPAGIVTGYCRCLEDLGYMSASFLKAEEQARNFRDGLADSLGFY